MILIRRFLAIVTTLLFTTTLGCATLPDENTEKGSPLPEGHPDVSGGHPGMLDPQVDAYTGYIIGLLLADEGQFDKALQYLEMSARLDSSSAAPIIQLMRIYSETNQLDKAEQAGRKALHIDPDIPEVHLALGQILLESDRAVEALGHLIKGTELDPDNTSALFLLSEAYERTGNRDRAVQILENLADTEGHEAVAHYYIARIRIRSGDMKGAAQSLVTAVRLDPSLTKAIGELGEQLHNEKRAGDAIELYRNFLERDPGNLPVMEFLAKVFLMEERYDEARNQLETILGMDRENTNAQLLLGLVETRDGNNVKALEIFNHIRRTSGSTFELLMQIGSIQRELKMYPEAAASFEEAADISPDRYEPHLNLAILHDAAGDMDKAEKSALKALSLDPRRSNIRAYLAQIMTREEHFDEAVDLLNEGLRESPNDTTLLYQLGITHDAGGQFDLTVKDLEKLLQIDPNHAEALNYLGYSWADRDMNLNQALDLIERALRIRPDAAYIIDSLGWVYYRMGNYEEALKHLLRAAEKMSEDPTVLDHVGDTYEKLGQKDLAVQYWSRALAADPDNEEIMRKLQKNETIESAP